MESRFNKKKKKKKIYIYIYYIYIYIYIYIFFFFFFGCVSLSGDMSCVGVDRSPSLFFVAQSDLCSR